MSRIPIDHRVSRTAVYTTVVNGVTGGILWKGRTPSKNRSEKPAYAANLYVPQNGWQLHVNSGFAIRKTNDAGYTRISQAISRGAPAGDTLYGALRGTRHIQCGQ